MAGRGRSIDIGLQNVGAALVARAACQSAHSLGRIASPRYVRKIVGGALIFAAVFATTNVGQRLFDVSGIAFIR